MAQRSRAQRLNGLFPLSYTGVVPVSPVNFVMDDRSPTINDSKNFYIGDLWLDISTQPPSTRNLWMLTSLAGNVATWDNFGGGDLQTLTGNSGGPVSPDGAQNINVVGDGLGITIAGNPGTNTLTASLIGGGIAAQSFPTDSGTATPNGLGQLDIIAGNSLLNCGSSVEFEAFSNTVRLRVSDLSNNTIIGWESGNHSITGLFNTSLGTNNFEALTSGLSNCAFGMATAHSLTSGSNNTFCGKSAGYFLTSGGGNTGIGSIALYSLVDGSENLALGSESGTNLTGSESSNILLNNDGVTGESNTTRIGTQGSGLGQQNRAFIAGVRGVTTGIGDAIPVVIDSAGQLGTASLAPTATGFFAFQTTTQSNVTGDGTDYRVQFDTVQFDTDSAYNSATGVYTVPTTGYYQIFGQCLLNSVSGSGLDADIHMRGMSFSGGYTAIEGSTFPTRNRVPNFFGPNTSIPYTVQGFLFLTAGTAISIYIQSTGGAKTDSLQGAVSMAGLTGIFYAYRVF